MSGSSSFSLNYPVVEEAVSSSNNLIKNINQLSETIRSYTNQIVSARGFSEYVGGISVDTFSGLVNECSTAISTTVLIIRNTEVQLLAYSENESDIRSFLDGLSNKEFNELNLTPLDKYISVDMRIGRAFTGLFASAGAFAIGAVEGGLEFLETGADLLVLGAGMSGSLIASLFDTEYSSKIMEDTRAFVSVNRVESAFNDFYENDSLGQSIVNNAYNFELCRSVGVGVGYSSALIGTSMLTGGLAAGGGIASIGQAGTVTVGRIAATAGIMGFSRGTEDAWNDGATTGDGLLYGAANAGWEATQWAIGARINQFGGFGDQIAKTVGGNAAQGIASRAALDTVDSGVEGFVQPALTMLYRDYGGGSFQENYSRAFEASGGWENVKSQAILGGVMSLGSELGDLRGVLESANESSGTISSINTDSTVHFVTEERFAPTSLGDAIVDLDSFSSAVDINIVRPDVDARVDASGAQVVEGATDYKVEVGQSSGGAKQINTGANQTLKNADARLEAANAAETALDARTAGASRQVVDSGRMNSNADVNRVNTTSGDTILRAAGAAEEAIDAINRDVTRVDPSARIEASGRPEAELRSKPEADVQRVDTTTRTNVEARADTGRVETSAKPEADVQRVETTRVNVEARADTGRVETGAKPEADIQRIDTTARTNVEARADTGRVETSAKPEADVQRIDTTRVNVEARADTGRIDTTARTNVEARADTGRVDTTTRTNVEARADTGRVETSAKPEADVQRVDTTTRTNSDAGTIHTNNASELAGAVALTDTSSAIRNADIIDASATVGTGLGVADLGVSLLKSGDNVDIDVSLRPDIDARIDSGRLETDVRVGTGDSPVIDGRIDGDSGHVYNIHDLVEGDSVGDVPLSALDYMLSKDDVTSYLSDFQGEEMLRPFHDLHERVQTEGIQVDGKLSEMLSVLDDRYVETIGNNDLYSQIRSRHSVLDDNRMTLELEERVRQLRPIEDLGEADLYRAEVSSVVADRGKFSLDQEFDVEAGRRYTQDLNAVTVITPTQTVSRFNDISENGLIGSGHHDTNFAEISRAVYGSDFGYSGTSGQDIKIRYVNHVDSKGQRLEVTAQIPLTINSSQLRSLETLNAELKGYSARTGQDIIINASVNDFNGTTGLFVREVSEGVPSFDDILGKVIVDDNAPLAHQEQFLVGRPNVENHFNDSSFDISTRTFRGDISSDIDTRVDASGRPDAEISRLDTSSRSKAEADDVVFVDDVTTVGNRYEHRNTDDFRVQRVHDDGTPYYNSDGSRAKPPISHDDLVEIINRNSDSRIESGTRVENEIRTKADGELSDLIDISSKSFSDELDEAFEIIDNPTGHTDAEIRHAEEIRERADRATRPFNEGLGDTKQIIDDLDEAARIRSNPDKYFPEEVEWANEYVENIGNIKTSDLPGGTTSFGEIRPHFDEARAAKPADGFNGHVDGGDGSSPKITPADSFDDSLDRTNRLSRTLEDNLGDEARLISDLDEAGRIKQNPGNYSPEEVRWAEEYIDRVGQMGLDDEVLRNIDDVDNFLDHYERATQSDVDAKLDAETIVEIDDRTNRLSRTLEDNLGDEARLISDLDEAGRIRQNPDNYSPEEVRWAEEYIDRVGQMGMDDEVLRNIDDVDNFLDHYERATQSDADGKAKVEAEAKAKPEADRLLRTLDDNLGDEARLISDLDEAGRIKQNPGNYSPEEVRWAEEYIDRVGQMGMDDEVLRNIDDVDNFLDHYERATQSDVDAKSDAETIVEIDDRTNRLSRTLEDNLGDEARLISDLDEAGRIRQNPDNYSPEEVRWAEEYIDRVGQMGMDDEVLRNIDDVDNFLDHYERATQSDADGKAKVEAEAKAKPEADRLLRTLDDNLGDEARLISDLDEAGRIKQNPGNYSPEEVRWAEEYIDRVGQMGMDDEVLRNIDDVDNFLDHYERATQSDADARVSDLADAKVREEVDAEVREEIDTDAKVREESDAEVREDVTDVSVREEVDANVSEGSEARVNEEITHVDESSSDLRPIDLPDDTSLSDVELAHTIKRPEPVPTPEHYSANLEQARIDAINEKLRNYETVGITCRDVNNLSSHLLESIDDLDRVNIMLEAPMTDINGDVKLSYLTEANNQRNTYNGRQALSIFRKIEELEAKIDMSLPPTERAIEIYNLVANEYSYSDAFFDYDNAHPEEYVTFSDGSTESPTGRIMRGLLGITDNNALGHEGIVCAGYAQLYKVLCERSGLQCEVVTGLAYHDNGSLGECHAWNVVIGNDGKVIPLDVTWFSSSTGPSWFGSSDLFELTHEAFSDENFTFFGETDMNSIDYITNQINMCEGYSADSRLQYLMEYVDGIDQNLAIPNNFKQAVAFLAASDPPIDFATYMSNVDLTVRASAARGYIYSVEHDFKPYSSLSERTRANLNRFGIDESNWLVGLDLSDNV